MVEAVVGAGLVVEVGAGAVDVVEIEVEVEVELAAGSESAYEIGDEPEKAVDGALVDVAADIEPEHVVAEAAQDEVGAGAGAGPGAGYNAGFEELEVQE